MSGSVVLGMTASQVQDSLGPPEDVDEKVYKSKTATIYKYGHIRANQYKSRIKLENGVVVGETRTWTIYDNLFLIRSSRACFQSGPLFLRLH